MRLFQRLNVLVIGLVICGAASAQVPEAWIVNQEIGRISIIKISDFSLSSDFVDIADPDGNSVPDTANDICMSTGMRHQGTHAFVTQGRLLTVIDVVTRTIVQVHDIATDLGLPALTMRGCSSSYSREFAGTAGPQVRNYLHIAATLATGDAQYIVVDQESAIAGFANPVVTSGLLAANATGHNVQVLPDPSGPHFHRAWYSVAQGSQVLALLLAKGEQLTDPWVVAETRSYTLPPGAPAPVRLRLGAPPGGELPVISTSSAGLLSNPGSEGACFLGGDIQTVHVSGAGLNSQTVLALDSSTNELLVVDPVKCAIHSRTMGLNPADIATVGLLDWKQAYIVNRGSNSVTRVLNNGTVSTLPLGLPIAGPVAVAMTLRDTCTVKDIDVNRVAADPDGVVNDLRVSWTPVGCPTGTVYEVMCFCTTTAPTCPCIPCDCSDPDPGDCFCPGFVGFPPPMGPPPANALQFQLTDQMMMDVDNPWDMLGETIDHEFDHKNQTGNPADWDYSIWIKN